ncbi:LOW QUALITY PROTEIN: hypothetical protein YC2023_077961 [Brassica napus]
MWKTQEQENERLKIKSREESSNSSSQMKWSSSFSKRSLDKKCSSINEERKITHQSSLDKRLYLDDDDEASVTFSFLHLLSLFVNDRNKRGRGSVGPRMDENVPYLPTEKVDQLQSSDTRERKQDDVAEVCGDIEFAFIAKNKSECLQEEWGVLGKSPEAALDVDQTIFVVTAEDVERSKRRCYGQQETSPARRFACFTSIVLLGLPPALIVDDVNDVPLFAKKI